MLRDVLQQSELQYDILLDAELLKLQKELVSLLHAQGWNAHCCDMPSMKWIVDGAACSEAKAAEATS